MNRNKLLLIALFSIACTAAMGAEIIIACPAELPADALKIVKTPNGWQPFVSSPIYLHSAAPIAGPPERLGRMAGRTLKRPKGEWAVQYDDLDAPYPEGVWFSCDYGSGNEFSIARKLEPGVRSCVVRGKKGEKAEQSDLVIRCK